MPAHPIVKGAFISAALFIALGSARAQTHAPEAEPNLAGYLNDNLLSDVFPEANRHGPVVGSPPAAAAYKEEKLLGYIFETYDVVQGVGYSRRPFHIVVGLDVSGQLTDVELMMHVEPIAILGRTDDDFHRYLDQFDGLDIRRGVSVVLAMSEAVLEGEKIAMRPTAGDTSALQQVDGVSRATTSSILFSDSIVRSARLIARTRGISLDDRDLGQRVELEKYEPMTWPTLIEKGAISQLRLTVGDVEQAFAKNADLRPPRAVRISPSEDLFVELNVAFVSPTTIGINILGRTWYDQYVSGRNINDVILFVSRRGPYSYRSDTDAETGSLNRLRLVQGDRALSLGVDQLKGLPFTHAKEAPDFDEQGLFFLSEDFGLDPVRPWRLDLLVEGEDGGEDPSHAAFPVEYRVPEFLIKESPTAASSLGAGGAATNGAESASGDQRSGIEWRQVWQDRRSEVIILSATLAALAAILSFQEPIVRRRRLHRWIRIGFLGWTLFWVGWYAGAQLTVLHLLNIAQSLVIGFDWGFFLVEPLIFVIAAFTVVGLFLWGRAVFCGWLCPFGALQELLNKIARGLRIPQLAIPGVVHERLIAVKYLIFFGLLALTFYSFDLAIAGSAVEPFKTAITFRFDAPTGAVAYALGLLALGLFVERFYCRFLCPLGAGLSILGRVRMFDWLKRRPECGNPCHRCEAVCPTGAIKRNGAIDMNECFYCLDCQVMYYDDHECPPLAARRKRLEGELRRFAPGAVGKSAEASGAAK